jgi:hypothetical protein
MKRIWLNLGTLVLLLGLSGTARATQIMYSAPDQDNLVAGMYCDILNTGKTPIKGTITANDYLGTVRAGPMSFDLAADNAANLPVVSNLAAYCKVVLTTGSTKKVRGVAVYHFNTTGAYTIPIQ